MFFDTEMRAIKEGEYIVKNNATVRQAAKAFGVSKSTVHFDVTKRLVGADGELAEKVKKVLFVNLSERHIRGGVATRNKFRKIRS